MGSVIAVALAGLGLVIYAPYRTAGTMTRENAKIEKQIQERALLNQNLRKEVQALQTPAGMEKEARRLGFVRSGEVALVIPQTR